MNDNDRGCGTIRRMFLTAMHSVVGRNSGFEVMKQVLALQYKRSESYE